MSGWGPLEIISVVVRGRSS